MGRVLAAIVATLLLAPLVCVLVELLGNPAAWAAWQEWSRISALVSQTLTLTLGVLALAIPLGSFLAVSLSRFRFPGRAICEWCLLLGLFLPLPLVAIAWQTVLGNWLPNLSRQPGSAVWREWNQGVWPAILIHGCAAVPWVWWIVSAGLRHTSQGLEDDATLLGGFPQIFRLVVLPRLVVPLLGAIGFVTSQVTTEITITDAMMVRTFAEEIYTQLVANPAGLAGALAITVPVWLVTLTFAIVLLQRILPEVAYDEARRESSRLPLVGVWGRLVMTLALLLVGFLTVLPTIALIWKTGLTSSGWHVMNLVEHVGRTLKLSGLTLAWSILSSSIAGILAASLALLICWQTRHQLRRAPILLAVVLAFTPGPLVGLGLKSLITQLMNLEEFVFRSLGLSWEFPPLRSLLYDQPTPCASIWACTVRFFPIAVALLYPVLRQLPREQLELATLDGVSEFRWVGWPLARAAFLQATIAVGVLSLGEVSASKLVVPPQWSVYILDVFTQMHYGTEATVTAMALVQVAITAVGVGLLRGTNAS